MQPDAPLKRTTSVCSTCLEKIPADVFRRGDAVLMRKSCATHGEEEVVVASDARFYWPDGAGSAGACGEGCGLGHSCTLMFEITDACNLTCPTCFASSSPDERRYMTVAELDDQLSKLFASGRGDTEIVQLSGGEPTLHPELVQMVEVCFSRGVRRVYLNTNGIQLGKDPDLARRLGAIDGARDGLQIYLQLDGTRDDTHGLLRGKRGLSPVKLRAIERAIDAGLHVHPVMTVTRDVNVDEIGDVVRTALSHHPRMNSVVLQPAFYAGRYEHVRHIDRRVTAGELARHVEEQTSGMFTREDFGPLPCSSPNCFVLAVGLVRRGKVIPISRYFPRFESWDDAGVVDRISRFRDRMPQNLIDVLADDVLGDDALVDELLDLVANADGDVDWRSYENFFVIGIKPFMDAHNYDQDRIDRCCAHVVDRDGTPVSLCEYNVLRRPRGRA